MSQDQLRRRPLIAEPDEPLLAPLPPVEQALRLAAFCAETGLPATEVASCGFTSMPAPVYRDPVRRWSKVRPQALWHPLFWLPDHLARRAVINDGVVTAPETDEIWLTRVMIELTSAGVWDEQEGTWVDVLSLHGIDIDNPEHTARVVAWLDGAADPVLDTLDISDLIDTTDPTWAVPLAWDAAEQLRPLAWYVHALSLSDDLDELRTDADQLSEHELASALRTLCSIAAGSFEGLGPQVADELSSLAAQCRPGGESLATLDRAHALISSIRDAWKRHAEDLAAAGEGATTDEDETWEPSWN